MIAFGGNALLRAGEKGTFEEQLRNVENTCAQLCHLIARGYDIVIAHGNSPERIYIRKAALNGTPLHTLQIDHGDLVAGGRLELWMDSQPHDTLD